MVQELNQTGLFPHEETVGPQESSLSQLSGKALVDAIREALKKVEDPEIHMDLITLNLIYDIKEEAGIASVLMTFTTPLCPFGPALVDEVKKATQAVPGVTRADVKVTFTPPWEPSPEIKMMLGI